MHNEQTQPQTMSMTSTISGSSESVTFDLMAGEFRTWGQVAASLLSILTVYSAVAGLIQLFQS